MTWRAAAVLAGLHRALSERLFPQPLASVEALGRFVGQRSAYVAQTALYGYLKTRMGTRFPRYFEDPGFAAAIKAGAARQFVSCAGDLSIYAAAVAAEAGGLDRGAASGLARRCFALALDAALDPADASLVPSDADAAFAVRAERTVWAAAAGDAAFAGSIADLIRNAPVIDEFKALDRSIVSNSIRFRWLDVRDQLRRRLDADAVCAEWRSRSDG